MSCCSTEGTCSTGAETPDVVVAAAEGDAPVAEAEAEADADAEVDADRVPARQS
ncbi:hypothetical protein SAMN05216371_6504 [Streptomyces sp. TLI_053]|uniref:hypothetical protein n=1 Tax=Streptomyces sp. TLI_053 TaxID=1855352 RepID=UPI00087A3829|nr:hypothetical protein [Streptomyces sp. TLI_053]SDT80984.1 hypothetical protein SAMN05216371_6504 [Streptomyces sp. TLI_053]